MKKKLVGLIAVVCMMMCTSFAVHAATEIISEGTVDGVLSYAIIQDNYGDFPVSIYAKITSCDIGVVGKVDIPAEINGYPVTIIQEEAFRNCTGLTEITIPDGITAIGSCAFESCTSLTKVNIPESVSRVGQCAFLWCSSLSDIVIPENTVHIGQYAFWETPWYENQPDGELYINKVYYDYKGTPPENTEINIKDGTVAITGISLLFKTYDDRITKVTIPDSVIYIQNSFEADIYCKDYPDGPAYINRVLYTYKGEMPENTTLTVKPGTVSISDSAFINPYSGEGGENLTGIILPVSITYIEEYAFWGCENLADVYYEGTEEQWWYNDDIVVCVGGNYYLLNANFRFAEENNLPFAATTHDGYTEVYNISESPKTASIIIADYNDGALTNVQSNKITFAAGETRTFRHDSGSKVFIWDSLSGMRPFCKPAEIHVQ